MGSGRGSVIEVRSIPPGVTSKAQAKMSAIGKPVRTRTIKRKLQFGRSQAGKTAEAI